MAKSWVSKELFENALQKFFDDKTISVIEYTEGSSESFAAESYCSSMFRSTITYKNQQTEHRTISVLVKRSPMTKQALRFTEELNYFKKEIEMFQNTLPEFHKILGGLEILLANSLYTQLEPFPLLIVENVCSKGYKMLDRQIGLNLEHCLCVARKLAELHAASLVLHDKNPRAFDNYSESMFWGKPIVLEWIQLSTESLMEACSTSSDLKKYAEKLGRIKDNIAVRASAAGKQNWKGFNVLNHGDPWTNNFLFSYDHDGRVKDMILVDYQVVVYGSPVIDLHYFWATSPTSEVRQKHFETIFKHYYDQLLFNLNKLKFTSPNLPTMEELMNDWISRAYYGLVSSIAVLPLIKCDKREDANWEYLLAPDKGFNGTFRHHVFNNPIALRHLREVLPFFDKLGVFDR